MPIHLTCKCGKQLKVKEELAGKNIRCPGCKELQRVPQPEAVEDVEVEVEEPRGGRAKRGRKWRLSNMGMTFTFAGWSSWAGALGIMLLAAIVIFLSVLFQYNLGVGIVTSRPVGIIVIILILAGEAAALAGYGLCIFVPAKTGARWWIAGALGLAVLKIAVRLFAYFSESQTVESWLEANRGLLLFGTALSIGEWVLLLVFLRMIAHYRYASWLMQSITKLIFLAVATTFCMAGLYLWMSAAAMGILVDDSTRIVYPRAIALTGLGFSILAGVVIFRQIMVLKEGRYLFSEAAAGVDTKTIRD